MADIGRNLLDLVFSNFDGKDIKNAEFGVVTPDYYHPPLFTDVLLPTGRVLQNQGPSYILFKSVNLLITVLLLPSLCLLNGCIVLFYLLIFIFSCTDSAIGFSSC
jgi:hypothetical protein